MSKETAVKERTRAGPGDDQVMEQHRELRALAADLREFLRIERPELGDAAGTQWASELAARLLNLHTKLYAHFRHEESSGFMDRLMQRFPRATHSVESLAKEHDWMLRDLNAILSAAIVYSEGKRPQNPHLRRWVLSLLDELNRHEREENDLFQRLLYEEIGVGD